MTITYYLKHLYKYPLEIVAQTHIEKYPTEEEESIFAVDTLDYSKNLISGSAYWRRVAHCRNFIPYYIRKANKRLDEPEVLIQEECWLHQQPRKFLLSTRMLTWEKYANCTVNCEFYPAPENSEWTVFEQYGSVDIHGIGFIGRIIEKLCVQFFNTGAIKGVRIAEKKLRERERKGLSHRTPAEGA